MEDKYPDYDAIALVAQQRLEQYYLNNLSHWIPENICAEGCSHLGNCDWPCPQIGQLLKRLLDFAFYEQAKWN